MSSNNLSDLWTFMSNHCFKMVFESLNEDLLCGICNKIMIDAYQSICGCRFCYKCLNEHIFGELKFCPGNKDDCKEEILILNRNAIRNNLINKKISKVKVYCPNESCEFNEELMKMEEHLRICIKQRSESPYLRMGCNNKEVKDKMLDHLNDHTWQHTHLLMNYIENMNNSKGENNEDFEICKREITFLKEDLLVKEKKIEDQGRVLEDVLNIIKEIRKDSTEKETQIIHLINEVECLKEELNTKDTTIKEMRIDIDTLKEINERKDIEMEEMKEELRMMKETQTKMMMEELGNVKKDILERDMRGDIEDQKKSSNDLRVMINEMKQIYLFIKILINEIKEQIDDQRKEIDELKIKDERRDREMEETQQKTMMEELENVKRDIVERGVRGDIEDQRKSLNDLRVNQENIEREINSVVIKVRDARIFDEREFIWRINDFSKMREDRQLRRVILWRYSLKLYLSLWCYGDYLRFRCTILKGEFDDILKWPMKHKITLSLINHATGKSHKSVEYRRDSFEGGKSVFNKPQSELWNYSFGDSKFTTIKEITETPELLLDDSLIVSFNIDYN